MSERFIAVNTNAALSSGPLVSAVITTHDRPELLKLAVRSVLEQTYENIELIVVNDNSGKETIDYLDALQAGNPLVTHIYIPPEETRGGNYARNLGIRAANGQYIAFLDDDDEWLSEKIEKQMTLFTEGTGLVYCGRYLDYINAGGSVRRVLSMPDKEYRGDLSVKCLTKIFCTTSAMVVKKELLEQIGGFDETLKFWQETELCIRLCQITLVDFADEPLLIYRINPADLQRLTNKYDGWLKAVDQINEKHKDLIDALPEEYKKERELLIRRDQLMRCAGCKMKKEKRKVLRQIWKLTKNPKDLVKYILNREKIKPEWMRAGKEISVENRNFDIP